MENLNIVFAADYIAPSPGAFIRSLELLSDAIKKNGGRVAYLFSVERDYLKRLKKYGNVYLCDKTANKLFSISSLINMAHALREIRGQVVHIQFLGLAYLLSAVILKFFYHHKIIVHYRNPPVSLLKGSKLRHRFSPLFYHLLNLFFIDANVVISESIKKMLVERNFARPHKIAVIYNGIDPEVIKNDSVKAERILEEKLGIELSGRFVVGMIANFSPQKDHATVINAASILTKKFPDIFFIFVGSEKIVEGKGYMEKAKSYVADKNLKNYIYFAGEMNNVYEIIPRFDIGLLISNFEGFGNALIEYALAGKPAIGTAVGGIKEIIIDGENGFLIPPGDHQKLAEKIELFITNARLKEEMGLTARKIALERFSLDTWVKNILSLYARVLNTE
ncbi:MAG: glycosyltransferase family 4 protein [candidate division WOR-3 bacterium]